MFQCYSLIMKNEWPKKASNVAVEDIRTGFCLKGVLIRPTVEGESGEEGETARFGEGYYVVTSGEKGKNQRMDAIVGQNTFSRIQAGEEVTLKGHLTEVDLEWTIFQAIRDVSSSNKPKKK
jgi:hypothetical protein